MHCLPVEEYTEKILLAALFSKISLSGSTEEWKDGWVSAQHLRAGGKRRHRRESKALLRPDQTLIFH